MVQYSRLSYVASSIQPKKKTTFFFFFVKMQATVTQTVPAYCEQSVYLLHFMNEEVEILKYK